MWEEFSNGKYRSETILDTDTIYATIEEQSEIVVDKIETCELKNYVSESNTCYLSGQTGKIEMPTCMDTIILQLCGIQTYVSESGRLIMPTGWRNMGSMISKLSEYKESTSIGSPLLHLTESNHND